MMNIYRMLVCVGIVLIQVSGANAQFGNGGLGGLINKKLNQLITPTNQPPAVVINPAQTVQPPVVVLDAVSVAQSPVAVSSATPTNQPPAAQPETTTATGGNNSVNTSDQPSRTTKIRTEAQSSPSIPPLFEAARQCDESRFAALLKKDMSYINKTVEQVPEAGSGRYKFGSYTPLAFAAGSGCTNIIQQLLDLEVNVNGAYEGEDDATPIKLAAGNGHLEAVKILLKAKANPNAGVVAACQNGHSEVLQTLLEASVRMPERILSQALSVAAEKGYGEIVQVLLRKSPNRLDSAFYTLRSATSKGQLDIVKICVANGMDLTGNQGKEAIRQAIENNQSEVVAYLRDVKKYQQAEQEKRAAEEKVALAKQAEVNEQQAAEKIATEQAERAKLKKAMIKANAKANADSERQRRKDAQEPFLLTIILLVIATSIVLAIVGASRGLKGKIIVYHRKSDLVVSVIIAVLLSLAAIFAFIDRGFSMFMACLGLILLPFSIRVSYLANSKSIGKTFVVVPAKITLAGMLIVCSFGVIGGLKQAGESALKASGIHGDSEEDRRKRREHQVEGAVAAAIAVAAAAAMYRLYKLIKTLVKDGPTIEAIKVTDTTGVKPTPP